MWDLHSTCPLQPLCLYVNLLCGSRLIPAHPWHRQMIADNAHNLRTPLTVIAGYLESPRDLELCTGPPRLLLRYPHGDIVQHLFGL